MLEGALPQQRAFIEDPASYGSSEAAASPLVVYFAHVGKAKVTTARTQIVELGKALATYQVDVGSFPTTEQGLQALVVAPSGEPNWHGPYFQKGVPPDPWNRPYNYQYPGTHGGDFDLSSYGKDGRPGGTGEDADITNW